MSTFVQRHRDSVVGVLDGFDRVRIRGTMCAWRRAEGVPASSKGGRILRQAVADLPRRAPVCQARIRLQPARIQKRARIRSTRHRLPMHTPMARTAASSG